LDISTLAIGLGVLGAFVIGIVLGAVLLFIFRGVIISRQKRIADRKAARTLAESRNEAKNIIDQAKLESDKVRVNAENEYRQRKG
jgi:2,3-bisphosphoglycerate-independent phosphoglycerate mutase